MRALQTSSIEGRPHPASVQLRHRFTQLHGQFLRALSSKGCFVALGPQLCTLPSLPLLYCVIELPYLLLQHIPCQCELLLHARSILNELFYLGALLFEHGLNCGRPVALVPAVKTLYYAVQLRGPCRDLPEDGQAWRQFPDRETFAGV
eukprot:scaffold6786_cov384-Prasinococcus_capsulatus_cf.AAC.15